MCDAWQDGSLVLTLPWVVEYVGMAGTNPVDTTNTYFKSFWSLLLRIRR